MVGQCQVGCHGVEEFRSANDRAETGRRAGRLVRGGVDYLRAFATAVETFTRVPSAP